MDELSLSLKLRGWEEFSRFLREFPLKAGIVLDEFKDEAARLIAQKARGKAPVRTGRLRDSIKVVGERVEVQAVYGSYVEYGTGKMEARPFLRPAVRESMGDLRRILASEFQDMLRRESR
ncbi:MAG: HK97 gp10 family phage protein [Nitrososphaerales archaeon]|nr:HK97 gp10 family phage protein [Nitrososphaerales archaeon]